MESCRDARQAVWSKPMNKANEVAEILEYAADPKSPWKTNNE